jgi:predicted DNA-binding antitoxin AbrB/MazE fold protein
MEQTFRAIFQNGVLRPLRPIRLKEKSHVLVTLHQESEWRDEFESLLRRMKARTKATPQQIVEEQVTRARAEVKANRRAHRRPA